MKKLTKDDLAQFTGTTQWYRHPLTSVLYTDGVKFLADKAGAYWLIDEIAFAQLALYKHPFQVWKLAGTTITVTDGNETTIRPAKNLTFTDFPLDEIILWVDSFILLPSEY